MAETKQHKPEATLSEEEYTTTDSDNDEESDNEKEIGSESQKWVGPYSSSHRILLVGEGDFSFSLSLAKSFRSARNIVATSIDNLVELEKKYNCGVENVRGLEEMGGLVLLGVDATKMSQHYFLKTQRFDCIVYNFPHVGFRYREASYCQILLNKTLVKEFLKNATVLMKSGQGEIHITHKEGGPYDKWDLVKKAEKIGLTLFDVSPFHKHMYPGYSQKRAHGHNPDGSFRLGDCKTYKFKLQPPT